MLVYLICLVYFICPVKAIQDKGQRIKVKGPSEEFFSFPFIL